MGVVADCERSTAYARPMAAPAGPSRAGSSGVSANGDMGSGPKKLPFRLEPEISLPARLQETFLQTLWVSLSEDMPSVIVAYNTQQLTMLGALFMYNGTILDSPFTWLQAGFLQLLAWGFVGFFYALDMEAEQLSTDNISSSIRIINAVLAFSLGLYVSLSINRWWEMRNACGAVIGNTVNLVMQVCMYSPDNSNPQILNLKRRITRYGTASVALLFVEDDRMQKLVRRKILTKTEAKALEGKGAAAMIMWLWIGSLLQRAIAEGILLQDINLLVKLLGFVIRAREAIQKVGTFINVQLPLPYVHVIIAITKLVFFMLTFQAGCKMFVALKATDIMALIMEVLILVVVPVIYQGLIDLTEKISNPFGGDEIDFPGEMYQKSMLKLCNEFIEAAETPPDWVPKVPDVALLRKKKPTKGPLVGDKDFSSTLRSQEAASLSAKYGPAAGLPTMNIPPS